MVCKFDVLGHDSHTLDMGDKVVIVEEDDVVVLKFLLQCRHGSASASETNGHFPNLAIHLWQQMVIFQISYPLVAHVAGMRIPRLVFMRFLHELHSFLLLVILFAHSLDMQHIFNSLGEDTNGSLVFEEFYTSDSLAQS